MHVLWHRLFLSVVISVAPFALLGSTPALSQTKEQIGWCRGDTNPTGDNMDQQIVGCTAVIESGTLDKMGHARVLYIRGVTYSLKGDFASALLDFDAITKILPEAKLTYRARINYMLAKFDLSAAELADTVAQDRYFDDPALPRDLYLARMRAGHANAAEEFTVNISKLMLTKGRTHPDYNYIQYEFFLDRQTPEALLAAAHGSVGQCDAQYSIAQRFLLRGDKEKAAQQLQATVNVCQKPDWSYWIAQAELERLRR